MPLLEREPALASLDGYAREARRGDGRLVLIAGEAGVGKSTLVEQLQADLPDTRWSWGACDGLFTPRPLGPLFDLADQLGGDLLDLCRAQATREELFGALLRQVNEPGALNVVVLEDVHWADEATVDLLRFLGRRIRNAAALLVVTYRDDGLAAGDPLRLAVGELVGHRSTRRLDLAPLSAAAVRVLAGGSGLEVAALMRLTGGNPFFVTEVVRAGVGEVPPSARDAVLARVARLSGGARELVDAAALTGTRSELRLVGSVTAAPPSTVDEVLTSGLLVGDGTWLRFRHEIARLAVEQAVPAHRRGATHARILAALRALGCDDDARLAFHAEAADDRAAVLRYAPSAARRAADLASHREAAAQYERALRFATGADPATVAGLCDGLAYEQSLVDRWQDAAVVGERALALWRSAGNRLREGHTLRQYSRTLWRLCRGEEAVAAAEAALASLEPLGPTTELAWAYANLAAHRMMHGEHAAAIELSVRARTIAEPLGVREVLSEALNTQACSVAASGGEWTGHLREALHVAVSAGLEEQAGRAYANLYHLYSAQRRFAEAEASYVDAIGYCDEHDIGTFATCLRGERTGVLEKAGRWDEAEALCLRLLGRVGASPVNRVHPLLSLGLIRGRRGDPAAWTSLDEALASVTGSGEPEWIVAVRLARGETRWLAGQSDAARREVELADDAAASCDAWQRGAVAVWLRRTGSTRPARGEPAEPYRLQLAGDWAAAAARWTGLGCPYDAALARLDGTDDTALRAALRAFQELGAVAAARVTRQRMRRLGLRSIPAGPRNATRADPLRLTRREREVLDLICAGHTNAEIAAKLFISAKTVDHHVSAVLAKLDAPTRGVAAAKAVGLGLIV